MGLRNVNLVPLLDFIVAVIPVLLLSVSFTEYVILESSLPAFADETSIAQPVDDKKKLGLTVAITEDGFVLGGTGGLLTVEGSGSLIKKRDGKYDYVTLGNKLYEIKTSFPDEWSVIIVPESNTKFDDIVITMDTARERIEFNKDGKVIKKIMFPNVILGGGVM